MSSIPAHPETKRKPVPKRLRFEILRRDNHTCRYCGMSAPDVKIQIDHVVPVVLGGQTEPENLVAACIDCNGGKASIMPNDPIVWQVDDDAMRWARAADKARQWRTEQRAKLDVFEVQWDSWHTSANDTIPRSGAWRQSLTVWLQDLDMNEILDLIPAAMEAPKIPVAQRWRYFCGCVWQRVATHRAQCRAVLDYEQGIEPDTRF